MHFRGVSLVLDAFLPAVSAAGKPRISDAHAAPERQGVGLLHVSVYGNGCTREAGIKPNQTAPCFIN